MCEKPAENLQKKSVINIVIIAIISINLALLAENLQINLVGLTVFFSAFIDIKFRRYLKLLNSIGAPLIHLINDWHECAAEVSNFIKDTNL